MESTMVIKVKYGEMLRRFNVPILENNQLDLDIRGLRAKIFNLFNFSPDTDVILTYVDEDGDTVTLVNEDDLRDVMGQQLKFLRIDVHLRNEKNERNEKSHVRTNGSSTPLRSPQGQCSFQNISNGISEILKSVPEPLPEVFSQLFLDFASKAALTSPTLAELAQSFIQLGHSHLNPVSRSSTVSETSMQNVATESPMAPLGADSKSSKDNDFHEAAGPKSRFNGLSSKDCKIIKDGNVTKNIDVDAPVVSAPISVDLNALPTGYNASGCAAGESAVVAPSSPIDGKMEEGVKDKDANIGFLHEIHVGSVPLNVPASMHMNPHSSPTIYVDDNFVNECPFSGVPVATGSSVPQVTNINPVNRGNGHTEAVGSMFHKGVICDGCGAHPITGPRFKSKVKEDYDLCSMCFAEMGNEADYIRIDRPVSYRHLRMKGFSRRHPLAGPRVIDILRSYGKHARLDSRFVLDVNVLDGTVMAPSTPFTKIWRLHNNGGTVWPRGTQLMWTGGDRFSDSVSVEIEVPADGLPVDKELDIAVDFIAPRLPGQYISYWRMASPSGQKFGQRVWVFIQVETSLRGSRSGSFQALDLNLPPTGSCSKGPEDVHINPTPAIADGVFFHPLNSSTTAKPVKPDHNLFENEKELQFPINDALLVGQNPSTPADEASSVVSYPAIDECHGTLPCSTQAPSVSYPIIDFLEPIPAATPSPRPSSMVSPAASEKVTADRVIEEALLKELDEMGFKQVELNKDVLRRTEYNLEQSVDELCEVAEWDPILEELEEMGFVDKEMNRRLLVKNNGSMKRVVMELISGEKA